MGIVHNAAGYLPELVKYFGVNHPNLTVKVSSLYKKSDLETLKMEEFMQRVESSYDCGTYRSGPLLQFSLVGTVQEESGGYFPEFLDLLEQCLFLKETMPWGTFSALNLTERNKSNDGPIMWVRPGEQVVPTAESRSPYKKRRYVMHIVIWFCCNVCHGWSLEKCLVLNNSSQSASTKVMSSFHDFVCPAPGHDNNSTILCSNHLEFLFKV